MMLDKNNKVLVVVVARSAPSHQSSAFVLSGAPRSNRVARQGSLWSWTLLFTRFSSLSQHGGLLGVSHHPLLGQLTTL